VIHKLVPSVVEAMEESYPEITQKSKNIEEIVKSVEQSYIRVRKERLPELQNELKQARGEGSLSHQKDVTKKYGELFFKFKDTYGLSIQSILDVAEDVIKKNEHKSIIDQALGIFHNKMSEQRNRSRASSKMTGEIFTDAELDLDVPKTKFIGYDHGQSKSKILRLYVGNQSVDNVKAGAIVTVVLDKTPFYAEAGGQVGDEGLLINGKNRINVSDTQKRDDIYLHFGQVEKGTFKVKDVLEAQIQEDRRLSIMRNHTATHLLQAALRDILGSHVKQQGSLVAQNRLRFDFTHHSALSSKELDEIEQHVNEMILANDAVDKEVMDIEKARKKGALAFFADKYGKTVRIVSISDYSKEFCGGTHLNSTGQIGLFKIIGEAAIAQGIRRIEAETAQGALETVRQQKQQLNKIVNILKVPMSRIAEKIQSQSARLKQLEKDYEMLKFEAIKTAIVAGLEDTEGIDGIKIFSQSFKNIEIKMLRKISDFGKQKLPSSIIILGAKSKEGASILIASSDDAVKKGFKANELIQLVAQKIGGSGGGRPQLAQAGGKDSAKLDEAIEQVNQIIRKRNYKT